MAQPIRPSTLALRLTGAIGVALLGACVSAGPTPPAAGVEQAPAAVPTEELVRELVPAYQAAQANRLLRLGGRDELIASALISFSPGGVTASTIGESEVARRLMAGHSSDELAVYVLALLCHLQKTPCPHPEYRQQLLKLDSDNAIHWLVVPSGSQLATEDLQRASESTFADTHFGEMLGIVRQALDGQGAGDAAPLAWRGNKELGLMLRRHEIALVPWPSYTQSVAACSAQAALAAEDAAVRRNCASLGALLFADRGSNLVTKSIASTMLRRFARDTPRAEAAIKYRRQYVWMSERMPDDKPSEELERLNAEEISLGEWEAYQRSAERSGVAREPPSDWVPKRPELLQLQEEREPTPPTD